MKLDRPTISAKKIPALKSESFSFEVDSDYELCDTSGDSKFTWIGSKDYEGSFARQYHEATSMENPEIPQNPLSSPREATAVLVERGGKRNWACGFIDSRSSVHG